MSAIPFGLEWWYAGHYGRVDDVDVTWLESVQLLNSRSSFRSVTVTAWLDVDMAAESKRVPVTMGRGRIVARGNPVLDGFWSAVEFDEPVNGKTRVSFTLSTKAEQDRGVWPNLFGFKPPRNPGDIVGWLDLADVAPDRKSVV